jgi:hypothetical protein
MGHSLDLVAADRREFEQVSGARIKDDLAATTCHDARRAEKPGLQEQSIRLRIKRRGGAER